METAFRQAKWCFASRLWFSCIPFTLLWSPGLTFHWDLSCQWGDAQAGLRTLGQGWGEGPAPVLHQDINIRPCSLELWWGTRAGFGPSIARESWVFPLGSTCFIRITAGSPGFLPALHWMIMAFSSIAETTAVKWGWSAHEEHNEAVQQ